MLDHHKYKDKPSTDEVKIINNRIIKQPTIVDIQNLSHSLSSGQTFIPAYLGSEHNGAIKRSMYCWTSQQVIALDFDNVKLNKKTNKFDKHISLTINQALEKFRDTASFLYTTFRHTKEHPKFRVVFVLDQCLSDPNAYDAFSRQFIKQYPESDQCSIERNRLFYGGRELHIINYDNRLQVTTPELIEIKSKPKVENRPIHFKKKNGKILFDTKEDMYNYLLKQDIADYLGVAKYSNCLFHTDVHKSASVFITETNQSYYKCHSTNCLARGNIFDITKLYYGLSQSGVVQHLMDYYNLVLTPTSKQDEALDIMSRNLKKLDTKSVFTNFKCLFRKINKYISVLETFYQHGMEVINYFAIRESQDNVFFAPIRKIQELCNVKGVEYSFRNINRILNYLTYLGLIEKVPIQDVSQILINYSKSYEQEKKLNYYRVVLITPQLLATATKRLNVLERHCIKLSDFTYPKLSKILSAAELKRVFQNRDEGGEIIDE